MTSGSDTWLSNSTYRTFQSEGIGSRLVVRTMSENSSISRKSER